MTEAPVESLSEFDPATGLQTSFFVDIAGRYVSTVVTEAENGCVSESTVVVIIGSTEDLHVQLVWHTPDDPDESDNGPGAETDLNLHYVHPNGCWEDLRWDCHSGNPSPNWGGLDRDHDDPQLNMDDTAGDGPENINHASPHSRLVPHRREQRRRPLVRHEARDRPRLCFRGTRLRGKGQGATRRAVVDRSRPQLAEHREHAD